MYRCTMSTQLDGTGLLEEEEEEEEEDAANVYMYTNRFVPYVAPHIFRFDTLTF